MALAAACKFNIEINAVARAILLRMEKTLVVD
jgi:hypothetical protein